MSKNKRFKVVVGISESPDSKVAAYLLHRQGYEVLGVTLFYSNKKSGGNGETEDNNIYFKCDVKSSKSVKDFCLKLGIQHFGYFADEDFKNEVIDQCVAFRLKSASQNPCFGCSKLTLRLLYKKALDLEADFISTGHFAKVHYSQTSKSYFVNSANDINSDQSFLIANSSQEILAKLLLPLGDLRKVEVLKIAEKQGWYSESIKDDKKCLTGDEYNKYLLANVPKSLLKSGNVYVNDDELSIGFHEGVHLQQFGKKLVGELTSSQFNENVVIDVNFFNGAVYIEESKNVFTKKIFLNDVVLKKSAVKTKPKHVIIKIEKDPISYKGVIYFKNNDSSLIILEKKISTIFPSGTYVTIYEPLQGGKLSVLGAGRVNYELKFLDIMNGKKKNEDKSTDFQF